MRRLPWVRVCAPLVAVTALVVGIGAQTAQQPGDTAQPAGQNGESAQIDAVPTFRSSTTIVEIDALVTDSSGKPVSGLTADDFEVLEAGSPREIRTFAAVDLPVGDSPTVTTTRIERDIRTNTHPPGRTYMFLLDEVSATSALRARKQLRQFVEKFMTANDVAAVALAGRGLSTSGQDFTSNKQLLLKAIDKYSGGFADFGTKDDKPIPSNKPQSSPTRQLAASMRAATELLATLPGRKIMVLVAERLGMPQEGEPEDGLDAHAAVDYHGTSLTPGEHDFHEAMAAATRGNVTIYPIDPRGLTVDTDDIDTRTASASQNLIARTDLGALADVTGGFALTESNRYEVAFERLVKENSSYYTLGFETEHLKLDGRFVRVDVRLKKPGLQVRSRSGFIAPLDSKDKDKSKNKSRFSETDAVDAARPPVLRALFSPVQVADVPMRVTAASYRGEMKNATVALVAEFGLQQLALEEDNGVLKGQVKLAFIATTDTGLVRPGHDVDALVQVKKEMVSEAFRVGARIVSSIELPRGRYQLRIASGGSAQAGSVVYDIDIPDFSKGAVTMSHVLVTTASAQAVATLNQLEAIKPVLPAPPIAFREFLPGDALGLYVEVYDNKNRAKPPAVTIELRDARGQVVRTMDDRRISPSLDGLPGGMGITATTPLTGLAPGPYVLRVEARDSQSKETAVRELPIEIH